MGIKITPRSVAVALTAALAWMAAATQAADVPVVEARRGPATAALTIEGRLEPLRQATVAAQLGGNVLALPIKAGDRVRAGQLLARIDERDALAGLQRSEAGVSQADAEARHARLNAERTRELRTQGFVSQAALDSAETQLKAAQSGLVQAQAARAQAALARGFASVQAPFDGTVLATHLDAGDLAAPGRPIATIYAPGQLRAVVQVGLSSAALARSATKFEVELPGGQRIAPERKTELSSADAVSQTVTWRLDLPTSATAGLLPGQVVQVLFSGARPVAATQDLALRVPPAAVLQRGELTAVYIAQGDAFVLRAVRVGSSGPDGVAVLAGLRSGERVAADALQAGLAGARPAR